MQPLYDHVTDLIYMVYDPPVAKEYNSQATLIKPLPVQQHAIRLGMHKRDLIILNVMNGKVKGCNLTRSGNGNTVELHIAGNRDNVANVTIAWELRRERWMTRTVIILWRSRLGI